MDHLKNPAASCFHHCGLRPRPPFSHLHIVHIPTPCPSLLSTLRLRLSRTSHLQLSRLLPPIIIRSPRLRPPTTHLSRKDRASHQRFTPTHILCQDVGRSVVIPVCGAYKCRKPFSPGVFHHHVQRSGMVRSIWADNVHELTIVAITLTLSTSATASTRTLFPKSLSTVS